MDRQSQLEVDIGVLAAQYASLNQKLDTLQHELRETRDTVCRAMGGAKVIAFLGTVGLLSVFIQHITALFSWLRS